MRGFRLTGYLRFVESTTSNQANSIALRLARLLGPLLFAASFSIESPIADLPHIPVMAGITTWMAIWWLSECVHLSVTSLLPFVLLPLCGISETKDVAAQYMDPILFLFIGGFFLAFAIERHGLHERIAGHILASSGHTIPFVLAGVMCTAWLISMWISNTATVMMLIAAVTALSHKLEEKIGGGELARKTSAALLIGLAYAASIGGMATLVGTPTNMIFYRSYAQEYGEQYPMGFSEWMLFAVPLSLVLLVCTWLIVSRLIPVQLRKEQLDKTVFKERLAAIGPITRNERIVALIFIATALLWFTRSEISIGSFQFNGWASLFKFGNQIQDGTVAIAMSLLLFLIPDRLGKGERILEWRHASRLPFEILLLFGSGFALSKGFEASGLSQWLANGLLNWKDVPIPLLVLGIGLIVTLISEFASNVASIQLVLPILISLQSALDLPPQVLLVPATLAASCGFMLPVATAPNTIAFSSGKIKVSEMAKAGILVDLTALIIITITCMLAFT